MASRIIYGGVLGFSVGIVLGTVGQTFVLQLILSAVVPGLIFFAISRYYRGRALYFILLGAICLSIALGLFRTSVFYFYAREPVLDRHEGEFVSARGVIIDDPDIREKTQRLSVKLSEVADGSGGSYVVGSRVLAVAPLYPKFTYGDEVVISGKMMRPADFDTDSGRVFAYKSYLLKDGVSFIFTKPKLELVSSGRGNTIKRYLFRAKHSFVYNLERFIPEPEASLLAGLLIGAKRSLGDELLQIFRNVGLVHIVVLSGYNLTVVAQFFMIIFGGLGRRPRLVLGGLSLAFFSLMVGLSATVLRAALMALLAILSRLTFRRYNVSRALALTAFLMLVHNPMILVFDPSFQLSFLATVGLIYLSPAIEDLLPRRRLVGGLREIVVTTLSTQIFVTPYLLYLTGSLSSLALLSNVLVLPAVPLTMLSGFLVGMGGFLAEAIAFPFAALAHVFLSYILFVSTFLSRLPLASITIGAFSFWYLCPVYIGMIYWLYRRHRQMNIDIGRK